MKLRYTNRKGQVYFVREVKGKRGKRYVCSQKESDNDLHEIPDTHEIVETPNGQVWCRKKLVSVFADEEISLAKKACEKWSTEGIEICVQVKEKAMILHERDLSGLLKLARTSPHIDLKGLRILQGGILFEPCMKLELTNADKRIFMVYRMCWIGGLDSDWLLLDEGKLPALLKKYVRHIGRESFYDLM